jgi:methylated-DNA-[protein]-cysteine S-methyltransferase
MAVTGELPRFDAIVAAPFGGVGVRTADEQVIELVYLPASMRPFAARSSLAKEAARQLAAYLKNAKSAFDLPLAPRGTAYQQRVWSVISSIPLGQTRSYGDVARAIRSGPRAVGQACGANWFPLVIPCHRVLAANAIGGFANHDDGFHLNVKRWLLAHEGVAGYA